MKIIFLETMQWMLLVFGVLAIIRLITSKTAVSKLACLNVLSGIILAFLVIHGVRLGRALYLDIALVYDIFGFLGLLAISHFLNKKIAGGKDD